MRPMVSDWLVNWLTIQYKLVNLIFNDFSIMVDGRCLGSRLGLVGYG